MVYRVFDAGVERGRYCPEHTAGPLKITLSEVIDEERLTLHVSLVTESHHVVRELVIVQRSRVPASTRRTVSHTFQSSSSLLT